MSPEAIAALRPVRLLVVQHDRDKPLGRIGDELVAAGAELEVRMAGGELPSAGSYDGLAVLPGLANPDDDDPALDRARGAIETALDAGVPVLGLCLGGQLLVQVLGGTTYRSDDELGFHEVRATPAAAEDPLLGPAPARFRTFHAHAYAFAPPPGAQVLLENDVCVQACRLGETWAFQCHPEPTIAWIDPDATERSMPSLATTPGKRLTIPLSSIAGTSDPTRSAPGAPSDEAAAPPACSAMGPFFTTSGSVAYGAVGTVMSPSMICCLRSSSCGTMSSRFPPVVE